MNSVRYSSDLSYSDRKCYPPENPICILSLRLVGRRRPSFYFMLEWLYMIKNIVFFALVISLTGCLLSISGSFKTWHMNWSSIWGNAEPAYLQRGGTQLGLNYPGGNASGYSHKTLVYFSSAGRLKSGPVQQEYKKNILLSKIENHKNSQMWLYQTQGIQKCNNCHSFEYETTFESKVCEAYGDIEFLILVESGPNAFNQRRAIRDTWGQYSWKNTAKIRMLFIFGKQIEDGEQEILTHEAAQYGDILQINTEAKYDGSTTTLIMFDYVVKYCPRAKFIIKTADDNYLNIQHIKQFTDEYQFESLNGMVGYCQTFSTTSKDLSINLKIHMAFHGLKKWAYPPYCLGSFLMMPQGILGRVLEKSRNIPPIKNSDAYLGILLSSLGIPVYHSPSFMLMAPPEMKDIACSSTKFWPFIHQVSPDMMRFIWKYCQDKTSFSV